MMNLHLVFENPHIIDFITKTYPSTDHLHMMAFHHSKPTLTNLEFLKFPSFIFLV
jgi:hypothetical protein